MIKISIPWHRLALIAVLAEKSPKGCIGRTGLMKMAYFLQVVRGVPLGYAFKLYSYGPYDTDVLDDLDFASVLGAVQVETKQYPNGHYGYEIRSGAEANTAKEAASEFLSRHCEDLEWVIEKFGGFSAPQLELTSTIVYVDQETHRSNKHLQMDNLVQRVRDIKPHFSKEEIFERAQFLQKEKVLRSLAE